nr:ribonuclease H-like domain-containing protein [Tanacetum cinerariifolium]
MLEKNNDALIIKEWVSDDDEEEVTQPKIEQKIVKPSILKIEFVKPKQPEKKARKTVKHVKNPRHNTHKPIGNQRNWNNKMSQRLRSNFEMYNKACCVYGSFDHLQANCNYIQQQFKNQKMVKPVWNYNQKMNHKIFAKKTHPHAKKNMSPRAVLLKSGIVNTDRQKFSKTTVLVNTARQVSTAHPKSTVNADRSMSYLSKTAHSTVKRPIHKNTTFNNSNVNQRVNTVRSKIVNTTRPKAVVNGVLGYNSNAIKASACWVWKPKIKVIDHIIRKFDGGCVAFGGNPKGGKITSKGTIRTGKLDFKNVYFVGELKFNLFSVSKMCDKKNSVLFNNSECIVLSSNFELIDESQVLLRVPRKNNMYSVDLKNIVFKGCLTCLFVKATSDESKLWHRSVMKKMYCLVVTDDYSRFTWVFFLATKDETSAILKTFITGIENLVDHKVKDRQEKDKIGSKPGKNEKRDEAGRKCSPCGALYTRDCSCSKGSVEDKILVPKPPKNCARCAKCGHPVNGPYCQGCALLREKLEEDLITYLKYFQDTSESSDDSTNIVNAHREPFVVKQDHGVKSSQNPPHIDKCCCEC